MRAERHRAVLALRGRLPRGRRCPAAARTRLRRRAALRGWRRRRGAGAGFRLCRRGRRGRRFVRPGSHAAVVRARGRRRRRRLGGGRGARCGRAARCNAAVVRAGALAALRRRPVLARNGRFLVRERRRNPRRKRARHYSQDPHPRSSHARLPPELPRECGAHASRPHVFPGRCTRPGRSTMRPRPIRSSAGRPGADHATTVERSSLPRATVAVYTAAP